MADESEICENSERRLDDVALEELLGLVLPEGVGDGVDADLLR